MVRFMRSSVRRGALRLLLINLCCLPFIANAQQGADPMAGNVTGARIMNPETTDQWLVHGGDYHERRFSALTDINRDNVERLGLGWFTNIPSLDGLSATPLVVDGTIYLSSSYANVFAIDARSGEMRWHYQPGVEPGHSFSGGWTSRINRGVAIWEGKVFVASGDCRLIAINAATGKEVWTTRACDPATDGMDGAPRVANGKVFIGSGVADFGARGRVTAYDANTGEEVWRFWTVPNHPDLGPYENAAMEMAGKTWSTGGSKEGGSAVWGTIVYDPDFNQVIFGTDANSPLHPEKRDPGGGDNLFGNSIVAVDADSGEYRWHFQTVPEDAWDYNANMEIILAELDIGGAQRKVMMQAPKNGFFFVIDRSDGTLLSAEKYTRVSWASHYDMKTGRPVELPGARYYQNDDGKAIVYPGIWGGHNWQPMSFNPDHRLVYFSAWDVPTLYQYQEGAVLGGLLVDSYVMGTSKDSVKGRGWLVAWDPVQGLARWKVPQELPLNGGTLSTAGNVVFAGTATGEFKAYDAESGAELWSQATGSSIQAGPVTYKIDGKQVVLAPIGAPPISRNALPEYGASKNARGPSRLMAFVLDGQSDMPITIQPGPLPQPPEKITDDKAVLSAGATVFNASSCWICHGQHATGFAGTAPDLKRSPMLHSADAWYDVVVKGAKQTTGMIGHDYLSRDESEAVRAYVIEQTWKAYQRENP